MAAQGTEPGSAASGRPRPRLGEAEEASGPLAPGQGDRGECFPPAGPGRSPGSERRKKGGSYARTNGYRRCLVLDHVRVRAVGQALEVAISDTGRGIPPEIQDKIFNPFFTTKDVGQGTGQGLSIALSIIQRHQGTIRFETQPGRGTTFYVSFPLE